MDSQLPRAAVSVDRPNRPKQLAAEVRLALMHGHINDTKTPSLIATRELLDWRKSQVVVLGLVLALVAGCAPKPIMITRPVTTPPITRIVVAPVPEELTREYEIAKGPLSQCPAVAAARKAALEACNADNRATREFSDQNATKDDR